VVILTLPPQRRQANINAHLPIRFARQPDLPCRACGCMTARTVYDSLGGFCTEEHKEWSVVISTLPPQRRQVNINAHLPTRFARQSQHR